MALKAAQRERDSHSERQRASNGEGEADSGKERRVAEEKTETEYRLGGRERTGKKNEQRKSGI